MLFHCCGLNIFVIPETDSYFRKDVKLVIKRKIFWTHTIFVCVARIILIRILEEMSISAKILKFRSR
jgi:hypothetical protein